MQDLRRSGFRLTPEMTCALKSRKALDNHHGPLAALEDWIIILAGAALILTPLKLGWPLLAAAPAFLAGLVLVGTRQRGLATLLHESAHHTLARSRPLNWLLGTLVSGWTILQTREAYRASHVGEHHLHLGDEVLDPDTANYVRSGLLKGDPRTFLLRHLLEILLGIKTVSILPYLLRDRLLPPPGLMTKPAAAAEYAAFIAFHGAVIATAVVTGFWDELLLVWWLPYLTTFQATSWLIETAEHFPLAWTTDEPLHATRNRKGPALERFFFGIHGESWHLVHHLLPFLPFWSQKAAHEILMADPAYAAAETVYGGLLFRGANGAPSILSRIPREVRLAQERRKTPAAEVPAAWDPGFTPQTA